MIIISLCNARDDDNTCDETTGASSYSETTTVLRVCTDGYFEIVCVSRPDFESTLLGKYYENGETSISGYPQDSLDGDEYNVIGYVSSASDYLFDCTMNDLFV